MNRLRNTKGFTIIEMLIAATVFSFMIVIVSGLYVRVLDLQRTAQGAARVQENALFVIETVSREVRVSRVTSGDTDCNPPYPGAFTDTITLEHPVEGIVDYTYDIDAQGLGSISRNGELITSPDVDFSAFQFCVSNSGPDNLQTRVTILITAENVVGRPQDKMPFTIQTSVASRDLITDLTD